jgi:hypothetical protein
VVLESTNLWAITFLIWETGMSSKRWEVVVTCGVEFFTCGVAMKVEDDSEDLDVVEAFGALRKSSMSAFIIRLLGPVPVSSVRLMLF